MLKWILFRIWMLCRSLFGIRILSSRILQDLVKDFHQGKKSQILSKKHTVLNNRQWLENTFFLWQLKLVSSSAFCMAAFFFSYESASSPDLYDKNIHSTYFSFLEKGSNISYSIVLSFDEKIQLFPLSLTLYLLIFSNMAVLSLGVFMAIDSTVP